MQIHNQTGAEDSSADAAGFEKGDWSTLTGGQTEHDAVWARLRLKNRAIYDGATHRAHGSHNRSANRVLYFFQMSIREIL